MSTIDTAAIRANWARAAELYPDGLGAQFLGLCDEIDALRAIRAERDALAAKVAAVEALCDSIPDRVIYHGTTPGSVRVDQVRAAVSGPVDDA